MVVTVVVARTHQVRVRLPVIFLNDVNDYLLSGDGRRPQRHWGPLAAQSLFVATADGRQVKGVPFRHRLPIVHCEMPMRALAISGAPGLDVGKGIARGTTGQMVELQEVKCSLNRLCWPTKK